MRKRGAFHKFIMMAVLVIFLVTTIGVVSRPAQAGTAAGFVCLTPCIPVGGFTGLIAGLAPLVGGYIATASTTIIAGMAAALGTYTGAITAEILKASTNLKAAIKTIWQTEDSENDRGLDSQMKRMTNQIHTMNAEQSRAIASFIDAANLVRMRQERENDEIESHREQRVSEGAGLAATVVGGMTRAATLRRAYSSAAPAEQLRRSGNNADTPGATGPAAAADADFARYLQRYCSKSDNNGAAGCPADSAFAGRDVDVTGMIFAKETIDLQDPDTKATIDDLIARIAEPFVKEPVLPSTADTEPGQRVLLEGESYKARRQVIYDALYHAVARRAPGSKMGNFVRPLREQAGINASQISTNPSYNEIMQAMTSERFRSGRYALAQIDEPENNAREMVIQQAFQLMQMSDQLDLMDHYALLLSAQAASEVREAKHPGSAVEGAPLQ